MIKSNVPIIKGSTFVVHYYLVGIFWSTIPEMMFQRAMCPTDQEKCWLDLLLDEYQLEKGRNLKVGIIRGKENEWDENVGF